MDNSHWKQIHRKKAPFNLMLSLGVLTGLSIILSKAYLQDSWLVSSILVFLSLCFITKKLFIGDITYLDTKNKRLMRVLDGPFHYCFESQYFEEITGVTISKYPVTHNGSGRRHWGHIIFVVYTPLSQQGPQGFMIDEFETSALIGEPEDPTEYNKMERMYKQLAFKLNVGFDLISKTK